MTGNKKLVYWQAITIGLMVVGYSGYYMCRSDFSVSLPLIIADMSRRGIPKDLATIRLGTIASLGVLAYAIGKFPSGNIADFLGGRRNFLSGMLGSVVFTVLFALGGGFPLFTIAWVGNRLLQSTGWVGMVKISSRWFPYSAYGSVMGIISLSFLFGDAACRQFMAWLIGYGLGWRGIFCAAAATLFVLFIANFLFLKETPRQIGQMEPEANPLNLFGQHSEAPAPSSLGALLRVFFRSRMFWLVCILSLGFTLLRETFNLWTPTFFNQVVGLSQADAAQKSALFPLFGGFSVLAAGVLSDRLGASGRAAIMFWGLLLTGGAVLSLGFVDFGGSKQLPVYLIALIGLLMIGPYSYLAGAVALDFGGKQGSATASGIIDGVGYLGGVLSGDTMARLVIAHGWRGAFTVLAGVAWISSLAAAIYWAKWKAGSPKAAVFEQEGA